MKLPEIDFRATIPVALHRAVELFGDREFIVMPDRSLTFRETEVASRLLAKEMLSAGIGKGTRVGFQVPNSTEWVVLWLAITRIGAIALPFSTAYKPPELRGVLRNGDVDTLIVTGTIDGEERLSYIEEALPDLRAITDPSIPLYSTAAPFLRSVWVIGDESPPWGRRVSIALNEDRGACTDDVLLALEEEVSPADWTIVIHTSGSSAAPKGVVHTHGSVVRHAVNFARFNQMPTESRAFCNMPFFWVGGVATALSTSLVVGNTILCVERWDPDTVLDLMEKQSANDCFILSFHRKRLTDHIAATGRDLSGIPALTGPYFPWAGGNPAGAKHSMLGMTETWGPYICGGPEIHRDLPESLNGSCGVPVPGAEVRIVDPDTNGLVPPGAQGEICVRGYSLMAGILKKERHEVFDDDAWYHTGDSGYFLDGYLMFSGRMTQMIKTAGANVSPREVELAIQAETDTALTYVVGLPDRDRGELVAAVVVPRDGVSPDLEEVQAQLRLKLSNYKVPSRWLVLQQDQVPMLSSGKPDFRALTELLVAAQPRLS
jgi:acyl-CoA synthetase (AMP-forming)/AMP-acid ligase II